MNAIRIGDHLVGPAHPPYFVADIGANHDGDLGRALHLIDLAADSGAHAAKFQHFQAETIVSRDGFEALGGRMAHQADWRVPVYEMYRQASVPLRWTDALVERCREAGVEYCTTPYAPELADHNDPHVRLYKLGSGDITWPELIRHVARKGKPVLLATGASDAEDVGRAMDELWAAGAREVVLMQCNTNYTGDPGNVRHLNLRVLTSFAERYPDALLGLSDHTAGHSAVLAALALGACVFEKHFTDDNGREGPDHAFAMTPASWRAMVEAAGEAWQALGDGVKRVEPNESDSAVVQRRALRYTRALPAGHVVTAEDLFPTRPCPPGALAPWQAGELIGQRLAHAVEQGEHGTLQHVARLAA